MIEHFVQEIRTSIRSLVRTPVFCISAVLTLALGCAATTAIFSILNASLLKPLPYVSPEQIVDISNSNPAHNIRGAGLSPGEYVDLKAATTAFADTAYSTDQAYTLTGMGEPETLIGYQLSSNFLQLVGIKPLIGRGFLPDEGQSGSGQVVLLSYPLWQRRFAGSESAIGKSMILEGAPYTVVGVMPQDFKHPSPTTDVWTPMKLDAGAENARSIRFLHVVARLKPGSTIAQADAQLAALSTRLQQAHPDVDAGWLLSVRPIREIYVGDIKTPLLVLQTGALFLLLIACANLANLLLARAIAQQRQFAIRMALGGGASAVFMKVAAEAIALSFVGAVLGVALAYWSLTALPTLIPSDIINLALPSLKNVPLNGWIMAASVLVCMLISLLMGVFPVRRSLTPSFVREALGEGSRGSSRRVSRNPIRSGLIIAEVALSLLLLICSGLMVRSMLRLQDRTLGFEPANVLTMRIVVPMNRYSNVGAVSKLLDQVLPKMGAIPGVKDVGATSIMPLSGLATRRPFRLETATERDQHQANFRVVTPDYFKTMRMRLVKGRGFDVRDREGALATAVINESLAHLFPQGQDPIGKRIIVADLGTPGPKEIIGVVADVRDEGQASEPRPAIYRPFSQAYCPIVSFALKSASDSLALTHAAEASIWDIDKELPINAVSSMNQLVSESLALRNLAMVILSVFGAAGLLLVALGLYGLISYDVSQRTHEIGLRSALGAQKTHILWVVMRRALILVCIGEVIGVLVSMVATKTLSALLFDVRPTDLAIFSAVCVLIAAVAASASLLPSLRALRVEPAQTLHQE
jgi:putative ABC transport system permease protein